MKTPYQRWQERTQEGRKMAGGWVHRRFDPPKIAQYDTRGHPHWTVLTWAYGNWWHQSLGDVHGGPDRHGHLSGEWVRVEGRYDWKAEPVSNHCSVNWGSVLHQAAELGNAQAKAEIKRLEDEYRRCTCWRSGYEGHPCPVHSR